MVEPYLGDIWAVQPPARRKKTLQVVGINWQWACIWDDSFIKVFYVSYVTPGNAAIQTLDFKQLQRWGHLVSRE